MRRVKRFAPHVACRMSLREKLKDRLFDSFPSSGVGVDHVKVARSGNLEQAYIFLLSAGALLLAGNVITAEIRGNGVIRGTLNQTLSSLRNRKLDRVGLAIMIGNFVGRAMEEFNNSVVAEMKLIGAPQINDPSQRDDASDGRLVSREAERQLASGRVPHHDDSSRVQVVPLCILQKKLVGRTNVCEGSGPAAAFISHAAIFKVGRRQPFRGKSGTQVTGVVEIVFRAPVASMDVDDQSRQWLALLFGGQTQIEKLVWVRAVSEAGIRRRG